MLEPLPVDAAASTLAEMQASLDRYYTASGVRQRGVTDAAPDTDGESSTND
jgi:hypothetical protein